MSNTEALRAAAHQALAAMEKYPVTVNHWKAVLLPAADALRAALAQQPAASGEPADLIALVDAYGAAAADAGATGHHSAKAYMALARSNLMDAIATTAQPAPARVPLTEAQIKTMKEAAADQGLTGIAPSLHLARAVEAWHGIAAAPTAQKG